MALCPIGEQPIIYWQYENEAINKIIGASNYLIQKQKYQCPIYYKLRVQRLSDSGLPSGNSYLAGNAALGALSICKLTDFGTVVKTFNVSELPVTYLRNSGRSFFRLQVLQGNNSYADLAVNGESARGVTLVNFEPINNQLDNCGNCEFKILKNNSIVYQKTRINCPTVTVDCNNGNCPINTCTVPCSNHLCCYDDKGNLVKTIYK